ncbi:MAG TPA: glycosyl transferase family 1, partial [Hyphomonadaceae bacterium]|nr:glycosyl transferase family 1 [Hyphomonadaceae bacterium]
VTPAPIEQALAVERASADVLANAGFRAGFRRLSRDLASYAAERGGISHVIALPFFAIGGAQLTAANFARVIADSGRGCVLIAADRTIAAEPPAGIEGALMLDFSDYFPDADGVARVELLFAALRFIRPQVFHAINSEVAWRLLIGSGDRVRAFARVFGAIFAFQFDWKTRQKVGYAATFLRPAFPHIDGLITDNQRFADDAIKEYDLKRERVKFHVVYNASDAVSEETRRQAEASLGDLPERIGRAGRLQVLWAGRLDAEKRPELLLATAHACPDMDFHVYGARVVDNELAVQFQGLGNVYMQGPYTLAQEVLSRREHHVMMFTSRWEGLANVLIEFGALGLPIVAATVGGVGELITDSTGYAVGERPVADDYVVALRAVKASPATAARKAAKLLALVNERHSSASFAASVAQIPGYLG